MGSASSSKGSITKLDTKSFTDTIAAYKRHVQTFGDIVSGMNSAAKTLTDNWKGKGRDAFKDDYSKVQQNLKDITDIMNEVGDALNAAYMEYCDTDSAVAGEMKNSGGKKF